MVIHRSLFVALLSTTLLQGCAYTVASTATFAVTGKSIGDHAASTITSSDCNMTSTILDNERHSYYCERAREPGTTYNRNAF